MAKFRAAKIEPIAWDMQGAPKLNPDSGKIDGKFLNGDPVAVGELPEPDPEKAQEFANAYAEMVRDSQGVSLENMPADLYATTRAKATDMLADIGVPRELLDLLPPRHFRAFGAYIQGELSGEG